MVLRSGVLAAKVTHLPSGDRVRLPMFPPKVSKRLPSGAVIEATIFRLSPSACPRDIAIQPVARAATNSTAAAAQASRSLFFRLTVTGAGIPAAEPAWAAHSSPSLTSCAVCHLSAGSFLRHTETIRSSAGGTRG